MQVIGCLLLNDILNVFGERDQILQIGLLHLLLLVEVAVIAHATLLQLGLRPLSWQDAVLCGRDQVCSPFSFDGV